jgi:hypothetical protein
MTGRAKSKQRSSNTISRSIHALFDRCQHDTVLQWRFIKDKRWGRVTSQLPRSPRHQQEGRSKAAANGIPIGENSLCSLKEEGTKSNRPLLAWAVSVDSGTCMKKGWYRTFSAEQEGEKMLGRRRLGPVFRTGSTVLTIDKRKSTRYCTRYISAYRTVFVRYLTDGLLDVLCTGDSRSKRNSVSESRSPIILHEVSLQVWKPTVQYAF